jgi:tetratricopeptide (TPR) repeat protein
VKIQDAFNLAVQHHKAGRLAEAESIYKSILAQLPNDSAALYMLGVLAQQVGRRPEAMQLVTEAIKVGPARAEYYGTYGELLEQSERDAEAIEAYRNCLALNDHLAIPHNNLGRLLMREGRRDLAIAQFEAAMAIQPNLAIAPYNLGRAYAEVGNFKQAIPSLRRAISLQPGFLEARLSLGNVLTVAGDIDEAIGQYREGLMAAEAMAAAERKRPANVHSVAQILTGLGDALALVGQFDHATLCFENAMKLEPDQFGATINYGSCLLQLKRYEEAVAVCNAQLQQHPDVFHLHYALGCALSQLGRVDESKAAFRRAMELIPPSGDQLKLVRAMTASGMYDDAIACYRRMAATGITTLGQSAYWGMREIGMARGATTAGVGEEMREELAKLPYLGDKVVLLHCDRATRERLRHAGLHGGYAIDPADGTEIWLSSQLAAGPDAGRLTDLVEQWLQWIRNEAAMAGTTCTVWMRDMPHAIADAVRRAVGEDLIEVSGESAEEIYAKLAARAVPPPDTENKFFAVVSIRNGGLELLPHWLEHYTSLGVDEILLGVFDDLARDAMAEIEKCAAGWKFRTFKQRWSAATESETYSQRETGCRLAGARPGTWILHTDLDELQQYPMPLKQLAAAVAPTNIRAVYGRFVDRVAADGSLPPIRPSPSLWQQFPIECNMTGGVLKSLPTKVMLARFSVLVRTGHHEAPLEAANPTTIGTVAHFKWHSGLLDRMRWGLRQESASPEWKADTRRFLGWLERHGGRINLSDPALGARMAS